MKLLTIIFIAAISISSVLPSSGDETAYTCPPGYKKEGPNCRQILDRTHCPAATGKNEGDQCVINSKYCSPGYRLLEDNQTCEMVNTPGTCTCDQGYILNEEKEFCEKELIRKPLQPKCPPYLTIQGDKCVGLTRKAQIVCSDDSNLPKGCRPMRFEKRNKDDCTMKGADQDPKDPAMCIYTPGAVWCPPKFYTLNTVTNMCTSDTVHRVRYMCGEALDIIDGQCVLISKKSPECTCSATVDGLKPIKKPILACFEGTLESGVCVISKNVPTELGCPDGFSADSTGTLCESNSVIAGSSANAIAATSSLLLIVLTLSLWHL